MPLYAHAVIEVLVDPDDVSKGVTRYERGDEIPAYVAEGLESVSEEKYDPAVDQNAPPAVIEIDGVRYVQETPDAA